jgi:hypothetical protein
MNNREILSKIENEFLAKPEISQSLLDGIDIEFLAMTLVRMKLYDTEGSTAYADRIIIFVREPEDAPLLVRAFDKWCAEHQQS